MYLLLLILFTIKVYAGINIFKVTISMFQIFQAELILLKIPLNYLKKVKSCFMEEACNLCNLLNPGCKLNIHKTHLRSSLIMFNCDVLRDFVPFVQI